MSVKGKRIGQYIVMAVLFVAAAAAIAGMIAYLSVNHGAYEVYDVMDGWTVDYCGKHYENISRYNELPGDIRSKKNDVLTMTRKIDVTGADRLTVRVYSRLSSVRVSTIDSDGNEKEVYFYGYSDVNGLNTGDFLGSGYHFVELPQDSYGKTLKIMEMGSQDNALQGIPDVVITSFNDAMPAFVQTRAFAAFVTIFMFLTGCLVILLSLFVAIFDRGFFRLTLLGLFSVAGALWCMCSSKAVEIFSRNIQLNSYIEYMSLYILIIPAMALALTCFRNIPQWQRAIMLASICVAVGLATAAFVLQKIKLANIDFVLPLFHILLGFDAIFLILVSLLHWRKSRISERFVETGFFAAALSGIAYMAIYYANSRAHLESGILDLVLVPAAFLLMSILIFVGYISDQYERRGEATQKNRLFETSGVDELTGLKDNIIGESELRKLSLDGGDYLLINFDLNSLGDINLSQGNATGDLFIKCFADILRKVFPDADLLCRMGGDEFFVVYTKKVLPVQELDSRFEILEKQEKEASAKMNVPVNVEASYGYALSTEVKDKNTKLAYQLANKRMYRMKTDMKNRRAD